MAKTYQLYEKRIQNRIKKLVNEMNQKCAEEYEKDDEIPEHPMAALAEYLLDITKIIIEECKKDEDAIKKLIPKYLPEGVTLESVKKKGDENNPSCDIKR